MMTTGSGSSRAPTRDQRFGSIADFLARWLSEDLLPPAQQGVLDAHYASYKRAFASRIRGHYESQSRELIDVVRATPGCRMLEVGSGCGTESLWAAIHGARVLGIDIRADRVEVARARQEIIEREIGSPLDCRFEVRSLLEVERAHFDVLWMEQAVHHLEPRDDAFDRIVDLVEPGGYVVVSEANASNPLLQIQLFLRRGFKTIGTLVDAAGRQHPYGNERVLRGRTLAHQLARRGVRRLSLRYFRVFPNQSIFDRMRRLEDALAHPHFAPLLTHYNYVGRKE